MYNKYKNVRVKLAGRSFASKGELECFLLLEARQQHGEIKDLTCQISVYLTKSRIQYICDFKAINTTTGQEEYFEYKGMETPEWRIKRKLWQYYGPGPLHVYKKNHKGIYLHETIKILT